MVTPAETARPSVPASARLERVRQILAHALREEGNHLWRHKHLAALVSPQIEALLKDPGVNDAVQVELAMALSSLAEVDALPWIDRYAPLQQVAVYVDEALARLEPATDVVLTPVGALLEGPGPEPVAEPAPPTDAPAEPGGEKSGRRRRKRKGDRPEGAGSVADGEAVERPRSPPAVAAHAPPAAPPPPPEPPRPSRWPLRHPDHTGLPLASVPGGDLPALAEAGLESIADLLELAPERLHRVPLLQDGARPAEGEEVAVGGTVAARLTRLYATGAVNREVLVRTAWGRVRVEWPAEQGWPEHVETSRGAEVTYVGRWSGQSIVGAMDWAPATRSARVPVYAVPGVDDATLHRLVRRVLPLAAELQDPLPRTILQAQRVLGLGEALRDLHIPSSSATPGRARLAFEELFVDQLRTAAEARPRRKGTAHRVSHGLVGQLCQLHGIQLNDAQELAFDDLRRDLRRTAAMNRLLQGDVGSGKAIVTLLAGVVVIEGHAQVLFAAPDVLAAEQRYLFAEPLLASVGVRCSLLLGAGGKQALEPIRRGEVDAVFTTHEVFRNLPEFKKLGLIVVEERSSFGVLDRSLFADRKTEPDVLVVTSVPIPASLTFTVFADHDLTVLESEGGQPVECQVLGPEGRSSAYSRLFQELERGRQGYVALAMPRGTDLLDRARGQTLASALQAEAFPGYRVALYHGGLSREERQVVLEDFQRRRVQVLVSTTTIEDAPEVSNATAIMVEGADRFDLVRLHRLRGHVSRGSTPGVCLFVLSESPEEEGRRRVRLVAEAQDGFEIAERDRVDRGDEALLGARAGELPDFRHADPVRDRELLRRARRAAFSLLAVDRQLRQRTHRDLARLVEGEEPEARPDPEAPTAGGAQKKRRRRRRGR